MNGQAQKRPPAWQPITKRGVAAFAHASFGRLLLVQFLVALVAAAATVWFLHEDWFPVIHRAIGQLPSEGVIRAGTMNWQGDSPQLLAEGRFIALAVDLKHEGQARSPAHLQVEFGQNDLKLISLFGFARASYPKRWIIPFNRTTLEPWWGAWSPPILAIAAGAVITGLMLTWSCLATLYFLPVWLVAFFANRDLTLGGSWRLAGAALMPGALFQVAVIVFYGLGALDLVRLAAATAVHFVVGWVYLVMGPLGLGRHPAVTAAMPNPFSPGPAGRAGPPDERQAPKPPCVS